MQTKKILDVTKRRKIFYSIPIITSYCLYLLETTIDFDASALLTTNLPNNVPDKIRLFVSLENPVDTRISLPSVCKHKFTKTITLDLCNKNLCYMKFALFCSIIFFAVYRNPVSMSQDKNLTRAKITNLARRLL